MPHLHRRRRAAYAPAAEAGFTRKQLAVAAGIGVETVRFYEARGLLPEPPRSPAGYRLYSQADVERVRLVRRSQQLGFTLGEIEELIAITELPGAHRAELKERAESKLRQIHGKIADLRAIEASLTELVRSCDGAGSVSACPIYQFMSGADNGDHHNHNNVTEEGDSCHV
ncbi:heavy metal-responsive transcriptional regulator [Verrucomicrobia bacterium LW23]|nr:heavy metal-responsive transcriptional regulator [Verrucomicrobia bacterium LW23]